MYVFFAMEMVQSTYAIAKLIILFTLFFAACKVIIDIRNIITLVSVTGWCMVLPQHTVYPQQRQANYQLSLVRQTNNIHTFIHIVCMVMMPPAAVVIK